VAKLRPFQRRLILPLGMLETRPTFLGFLCDHYLRFSPLEVAEAGESFDDQDSIFSDENMRSGL
jgi:hypothetical protein